MDFTSFPKVGSIAKLSVLQSDFDMSIREATRLMYEKGVSSIVIEKGEERYVFSIEELLSYIHHDGNMEARLSSFPVKKITCVSTEKTVLSALELLEQSGQRYLAATDASDKLVGIVTYTDLLGSIDPTILMERKTVGDFIFRGAPTTFTPDWILEDVLHHFVRMEDSIIVVEAGRPVGIITTKDVFQLVANQGDVGQPLSHYMTSPVITTPRTCSIHDALMQLKHHHIKRAIVVDNEGRLIGVVAQSELVGFAYGAWVNILKHHTTELHELVEMLKEKNRTLELIAHTDSLTGLGNKRLLHQEMGREIERMERYGSATFSMVIFDVDMFKKINDSYGHITGDEVLREIATRLRVLIRRNDIAARWGGDEFAILLRNTPLSSARDFAERLRSIIQESQFVPGNIVTISAGVGEYRLGEHPDRFFHRIDNALYQAKNDCRNRVQTSD